MSDDRDLDDDLGPDDELENELGPDDQLENDADTELDADPDTTQPHPSPDDEETTAAPVVERGEPLHLAYATHSEIGLVRKNNQDSGYASAHLVAVADGMGGAAAGDLASAVAIQLVRRADRDEPIAGEQMLELLAGAIDQANEKIADLVADDPALEGMGTTFTGALFDGHQLGLAHIGDSRAYLLRDGELTRLTHDHSWVQSLVDEGRITEDEAAYHPHRSLLLKVLNGHPANDPDTGLVDVAAGDRLLLCSDGLCGLVDDTLIRDVLTAEPDRERAIERLVAAAHREGGIDNITIVLADVSEEARAGEAEVIGAATDREIPVVGRREGTLRRSPGSRSDAPVPDAPEASSPVSPDDEDARYAPRERTGRPLWRGLLVGLVCVAVVLGGLFAGWRWSRTQYYVGASEGNVAIFRGLAQQVLGKPLGEVIEVEPTQLDDLPAYLRQSVERTITADDLADAHRVANELRVAADQCIRVREQRNQPPTTPPNPEPTPGVPTTPTPPTAVATPDPSGAC